MIYRHVASLATISMLTSAERLVAMIEPNWSFDPETRNFYVLLDGKRYDIEFGADDVETEFVQFASKHLKTIVEMARGRLVI